MADILNFKNNQVRDITYIRTNGYRYACECGCDSFRLEESIDDNILVICSNCESLMKQFEVQDLNLNG